MPLLFMHYCQSNTSFPFGIFINVFKSHIGNISSVILELLWQIGRQLERLKQRFAGGSLGVFLSYDTLSRHLLMLYNIIFVSSGLFFVFFFRNLQPSNNPLFPTNYFISLRAVFTATSIK